LVNHFRSQLARKFRWVNQVFASLRYIFITNNTEIVMGMALKADVAEACKSAGTEKPVDLVHLSTITMGDRALELEVLKMFLVQIPDYIKMLKSANDKDSVYMAAHTLKGASSNIGAFPLANIAKQAEETGVIPMQEFVNELGKIADYVSELSCEA
jgi:HPt (histidine-containing phosphotransfer) domain-containing protein